MSYTLHTPVIGGQQGYVDEPSSGPLDTALLYFHGATENGSEISTGANGKTGVVAAFQAQNWINCGINAYGDAWGNAASLANYLAFVAYILATFPSVTRLLAFSQSMGGIPGLLTVAGGAVPFAAWAGVSPACSLRSIWDGGGTLATQIETAYGISPPGNLPSYLAQTAGHDPLLLDPATSYSGTPLRFYASPGDSTVPTSSNTVAMQAAVAPTSRYVNGIRFGVGDHTDPSDFQPTDLVAFYNACMNGTAYRRRLASSLAGLRLSP